MSQLQYSPLRSISLPLAAGAVIEPGDGVCLNASAFAVPASEAPDLKTIGKAVHRGADNTNGAAGAVRVQTYRSGPDVFAYANSTGADEIGNEHLGLPCYWAGPRTVALTDGEGARSLAGYVAKLEGGAVFVEHPIAMD